jgi:hypothetical protein
VGTRASERAPYAKWLNGNSANDRGTAVLALVLVVTLIAGFVGLAIADVDTTAYVAFCAGPVVSTAVGIILARKVGAVADVVDKVEAQTNGIATAQRDSLDAHLTAQDQLAGEAVRAAQIHAQRVSEGAVNAPHAAPADGA